MVAETGPRGRVLPTIHVSVNTDVDGPPLGQQHSPGNDSDLKTFHWTVSEYTGCKVYMIISFGASGDTCLSGPLTSEAPFTCAVWSWADPLPSCSSAFPSSEEDHGGTYSYGPGGENTCEQGRAEGLRQT